MISICTSCKHKDACDRDRRILGYPNFKVTECKKYEYNRPMTKEDAIKTLHELWRETNDSWYEETYNMAIEALSVEPTKGYSTMTDEYDDAIEALSIIDIVDLTNGNTITKAEYDGEPSEHSDIISRANAIEAIASKDETDGTEKVFSGRQVNEILSALPPADRPSGEWTIEISGNGWNDWTNVTCSVCGQKFEKFGEHNYCPNCGARMIKKGDTE